MQNLVISRSCFAERDKEWSKIQNAHTELLHSLNILFGDVVVAVAVEVC